MSVFQTLRRKCLQTDLSLTDRMLDVVSLKLMCYAITALALMMIQGRSDLSFRWLTFCASPLATLSALLFASSILIIKRNFWGMISASGFTMSAFFVGFYIVYRAGYVSLFSWLVGPAMILVLTGATLAIGLIRFEIEAKDGRRRFSQIRH
jgi:hypothetical protein